MAALAWAVHFWADRAADPAHDDAREVAEHARNPPERLVVPDGLRLADGTGADIVDPRLLDVSLDRTQVRVHGREVVAVPSVACEAVGSRCSRMPAAS